MVLKIMRSINLNNNSKVILSDTVGFISNLPTELIAAFRATLEEVLSADLIIHVRDISHENTEDQNYEVLSISKRNGFKTESGTPVINSIWCVFNTFTSILASIGISLTTRYQC